MKIIIRNSSDQPIYEQIYQQIKSQIISEQLPQGTALPSIRMLAKDLKISVITTKRAYDELTAEGFVDNVPGKGFFVSEKNLKLVREHHLRDMETHLASAVELAKSCNVSESEIIELIHTFFEE